MPIPIRREAGIAMQVSVDSEDEDDWGHFSFEDGDAPRRASRITGGTDDDDRRPPHFLSLSQIPSTIACNT